MCHRSHLSLNALTSKLFSSAFAHKIFACSAIDDLREAVTTLEDTVRTARQVLGGANPITTGIKGSLQNARANLRARETPSPGPA